jgi:hypothetical protein
MGDPPGVVDLAEAIAALRRQLTEAIDEGKDQHMQFEVKPIELRIQAIVTKGAGGGLSWSIVSAEGSYEASSTQELTLTLIPVWKRRDGTLERDFTVSAAGSPADRHQFGPKQ